MAHGKRKRITIKPASPPNSEINITPMVDVVLVLLIIFMVVTPLLEKDIEVKVPDTDKVEEQQDLPEDQLVVSIASTGEMKINADVMATQKDYVDNLSRMIAAKKKGDRLVFFTADDQAPYPKIVAALDGARQAGAETLGIATEKIEDTAGGAPAAPDAPPAPPTP